MGQLLNATCKKCGFQREFQFGAGIKNFPTVCMLPGIEKESGDFAVRNYLEKSSMCEKLDFYNKSTMYKPQEKQEFYYFGDVLLNEKSNLCPKCRDFTLDFEFIGTFE